MPLIPINFMMEEFFEVIRDWLARLLLVRDWNLAWMLWKILNPCCSSMCPLQNWFLIKFSFVMVIWSWNSLPLIGSSEVETSSLQMIRYCIFVNLRLQKLAVWHLPVGTLLVEMMGTACWGSSWAWQNSCKLHHYQINLETGFYTALQLVQANHVNLCLLKSLSKLWQPHEACTGQKVYGFHSCSQPLAAVASNRIPHPGIFPSSASKSTWSFSESCGFLANWSHIYMNCSWLTIVDPPTLLGTEYHVELD